MSSCGVDTRIVNDLMLAVHLQFQTMASDPQEVQVPVTPPRIRPVLLEW